MVQKQTFDKIGKKLRQSVDETKEYEVIEDESEVIEGFTSSLFLGVRYQEYIKAQKLKKGLLETYVGKTLEDVIPGSEFHTEKGICYHIENRDRINLKIISPDKAREEILSNLKLIYGVGDLTECILKNEGYKTIEDLTNHPRFSFEAKKFLEIVDMCDTYQIINWISHWFSKSHPLVLYSSGFFKKENFIILDIETMGLFSRPIILLGAAQIHENEILVNQYLLRSIKEEPAALAGLLSHLREDSALITFNGRTFDVPYIKERLAYYRMIGDLEKTHFDILHFSRRAWRKKVPNCKLTTLEEHLFGIKRKDDVPSALVPEFYEAYMKTKNIGPIIPIIDHNRQDLITLANIFSKLHEVWGEGGESEKW